MRSRRNSASVRSAAAPGLTTNVVNGDYICSNKPPTLPFRDRSSWARGGFTTKTRSSRRLVGMGLARGLRWPRNDTEDHGKGIGRARAQRSGARYRNRCARWGDVVGARRGFSQRRKARKVVGRAGDSPRRHEVHEVFLGMARGGFTTKARSSRRDF
jgi:hypothetical protein